MLTAVVDGGTVGLNGRGASGAYGSYVIRADDSVVIETATRLPLAGNTNNTAECEIVLKVLDALEARGLRGVRIVSDSAWVVKAVSGQYRIKAAHLIPLVREIQRRLRDGGHSLAWRAKFAEGGTWETLGH